MLLFDLLAEKRIEQARDAGAFDNLPGAGKPLPEEDLCLIPEEERVAYRILKNAGYMPPELALHRQALDLAMRLAAMPEDDAGADRTATRAVLLDRLARINLCLAEAGKPQLIVPSDYLARMADKLGH